MRRIGWIFLLGMLLTGCAASPATRPAEATPTSAAPAETITVSADGLSIVVPGYKATCTADATLFIPMADDGWKPLENYVLRHHYLDDTFKVVAGMCDIIVCSKVSQQRPIQIGFPLYEYLGERQHVVAGATSMVPAYRTVYPSGTVRLKVPYFLDEACSQPQTYRTTLNLPN